MINAEEYLSHNGNSTSVNRLKNDIHKFRRSYPEITFREFQIGNSSKIAEYDKFINLLKSGEYYRIVFTSVVMAVLVVIVALSWSSTCFKTSTLFILSIIFAFIGLLALHFSLGAQLAASVAISDFCIKPAAFIERSVLMENWLNQNEIDIFLNCERESDKISRYNDLYKQLDSRKVRFNPV